jgi:cell division septum initiation protein DivIVA
MALDPTDPAVIARHDFDVARRGYDQQAVRGYLHTISQLVASLQEQVSDLTARLHRAEAAAARSDEVDEAHLLEVLGEETTRVLQSAHEASAEIRTKAEEGAARLISDAQADAARMRGDAVDEAGRVRAEADEHAHRVTTGADESAERTLAEAERHAEQVRGDAEEHADRIRAEADGLLDRRRDEAEAAATAILEAAEDRAAALLDEAEARAQAARDAGEADQEAARERGREMVAEAQAVRERVLRDLAVRRKKARQQVEKLNAGRERLLQAYATVRSTLDEATLELTASLGEARVAADAAARRVADEPEPDLDDLEAEGAQLADRPAADPTDDTTGGDDDHDDGPGPLAGEVPAVAPDLGASGGEPDAAPPEASGDVAQVGELPGEAAAGVDAGGGVRVTAERADPDALVDAPPAASPAPGTGSPRRRLSSRRRRAVPADAMAGLPEGALSPVDPAADFEEVRVLETATPEQPAEEPVPEAAAPDRPAATEPTTLDQAEEDAAEDTRAEGPAGDTATVEADIEDTEIEDQADVDASDVDDRTGVADVGGPTEDEGGVAPDGDGGPAPTPSVDALFARLREVTPDAEGAEPSPGASGSSEGRDPDGAAPAEPEAGAAPAADPAGDGSTEAAGSDTDSDTDTDTDTARDDAEPIEPEVDPDAGAIAARDEALAPIERDLAKRLKRLLTDEQNEVLDLLRRMKPTGAVDLLGEPDDHAARWAEVAVPALTAAAAIGAATIDPGAEDVDPGTSALDLALAVTGPLRERVERCFVGAEGDLDEVTERVRALYREWKSQRVGEAARHHVVAAHAAGAFAVVPAGCGLRWVVDRAGEPCPDAEDNALAGVVPAGEPFPTGVCQPPAHPGCRCMVLPA